MIRSPNFFCVIRETIWDKDKVKCDKVSQYFSVSSGLVSISTS